MTKCEELQFDLPLYFDGSLNADERASIDAHLPECPLCRQKLSEFEELSYGLKSIPRFSASESLVTSIRASVAAQLEPVSNSPTFRLIDRRRSWTEIWLMPLSAGGLATVLIGFTLLSFMLTVPQLPVARFDEPSSSSSAVFITNIDLSPVEYASTRLGIGSESPSINPRGPLIELTKTLLHDEYHDDDEVVVVADVYGNGNAEITEVVEPSHDRNAIAELQKALRSGSAAAPFVPANLDQRSDTIRVIFKIQNVNVKTYSEAQ